MAERTLYFLKSAKEICLYHRLTTCRIAVWRMAKIGYYNLMGFCGKAQREFDYTFGNALKEDSSTKALSTQRYFYKGCLCVFCALVGEYFCIALINFGIL